MDAVAGSRLRGSDDIAFGFHYTTFGSPSIAVIVAKSLSNT